MLGGCRATVPGGTERGEVGGGHKSCPPRLHISGEGRAPRKRWGYGSSPDNPTAGVSDPPAVPTYPHSGRSRTSRAGTAGARWGDPGVLLAQVGACAGHTGRVPLSPTQSPQAPPKQHFPPSHRPPNGPLTPPPASPKPGMVLLPRQYTQS